MMLGLGQAVSEDLVRRIQIVGGMSPSEAGIVYPSWNPEDYPYSGTGVTTATPAEQAAALRWLAENYPEQYAGTPIRYEDGVPVYGTTVTSVAQTASACASGMLIPCVPNWLLILAAALLLLAMRRK